jgi:hypothetical protein
LIAQTAFADKMMTCEIIPWFNNSDREQEFIFKYEERTFLSDRVYFRQDGKWLDFCEGFTDVADMGASCTLGFSGVLLNDNLDRSQFACENVDTGEPTNQLDDCGEYAWSLRVEHLAVWMKEFTKRRLTLDFLLMEARVEAGKPERIKSPDEYGSKTKGMRLALGPRPSINFEPLYDLSSDSKCEAFDP